MTIRDILIPPPLRFILKVFKPRHIAPPHIRQWLKEHGEETITKISVCRTPVVKAIQGLLNVISLGKWNKAMNQLSYSDIFHLYLYVTIGDTTYRIEKNAVVELSIDNRSIGEDCMDIPLPTNRSIQLKYLILNGESFQEDFWNYHPKDNNCQNFVMSILFGNGLTKLFSTTHLFVYQNATKIFDKNPGYLSSFAGNVTDIAGVFDVVIHGY